MKRSDDTATIRRLRSDVALQISRFLQRQQLSPAAAAKSLLHLVLQIGAVPEEAGAFLSMSSMRPTGTRPRSKLADDARDAMLATVLEVTPEQRLIAHLKLCKLAASCS